MKNLIHFIIWNIFAVLSILLILEGVALFKLQPDGISSPYVFNIQKLKERKNLYIFEEADPLLGWRIADGDVQKDSQLREENHLIFYTNKPTDCDSTIKILITGGSTSDVTYYSKNWPYFLHKILLEQHLCYEICNGAVSGYNTGQELFKLLRDGMDYQPDIHISFSGANDMNPVYDYHNESPEKEYTLFPNLMKWIERGKQRSHENKDTLKQKNASDYWWANMTTMKSIAHEYQYKFIGILQPVAGMSQHILSDSFRTTIQYEIERYNSYYPQLQERLSPQDKLLDFTALFDSIENQVFIDDCHIKDTTYQKMIAKEIAELIIAYQN